MGLSNRGFPERAREQRAPWSTRQKGRKSIFLAAARRVCVCAGCVWCVAGIFVHIPKLPQTHTHTHPVCVELIDCLFLAPVHATAMMLLLPVMMHSYSYRLRARSLYILRGLSSGVPSVKTTEPSLRLQQCRVHTQSRREIAASNTLA